jgi:Fe2+ transport system protein FeoA
MYRRTLWKIYLSLTENISTKNETPSLSQLARGGRSYLIVANNAAGKNRMHMDSLGLIPGEVVHVLFKNFSGLIVAIKGSRLALGKTQAKNLLVREYGSGEK